MKIRKPHITLFYTVSIVLLLVLFACSNKRNTFGRRVYHNLTAHYNAYWNGNESLKEAVKQLDSQLLDDYTQVLPIYSNADEQQIKAIQSYLDRTIEKASMVIQDHSMKFKSKEHNKWVDDCYLLIGKAYFYKKDYVSARRTFSFIQDEFKEEKIRYDANMWLIRTYIQAKEFEKSLSLLREFDNNFDELEVPYYIQRIFYQNYAHHYILSKNYSEAIPYLEKVIQISSNKKEGSRYRFILGQVYHLNENFSEARKLFKEVIKRNPEYRLEFQAELHIAKVFNPDIDNYGDFIRKFEKMLRDEKNQDYKDLIYFAMAEIAKKNNMLDDEMSFLKQSVMYARNDSQQKVASSIRLARIYFDQDLYQKASVYYDTVKQFIRKDYPDYQNIVKRTDLLSVLVNNHQEILKQDSLQLLASMPESDRNEIISDLIEQKNIQKEKAKAKNESPNFIPVNQYTDNQRTSNNAGAWYFYNPTNISYGYSEFMRKWGNRSREDNWRLLDKQIAVALEVLKPEELDQEGETEKKLNRESESPNDFAPYLKEIPLTPDALQRSNQIIIEAYYENGFLYEDGLERSDLAIECFEAMIDRYPRNIHLLNSYYHLYLLHKDLNNIARSDDYKNLILREFPDSGYAGLINDPNTEIQIGSQNLESNSLYSQAYSAYINKQYFTSIEICNTGLSDNKDLGLSPKFDFLRALSLGKVEVADSLIFSLERIIVKYPDHELAEQANNILSILILKNTENIDIETDTSNVLQEEISPYNYKQASSHNYILMIEGGSVNLDSLSYNLANFNRKIKDYNELTISSFDFSETHKLILIARFKNSQAAKEYEDQLIADQAVNRSLSTLKEERFLISNDNYVLFYQLKNLNEYLDFYNRYYQ